MAGNNCEMLTITSFHSDPESIKNRKGVIITGRVHPGESGASWMMKGIIDFLVGPTLDATIKLCLQNNSYVKSRWSNKW